MQVVGTCNERRYPIDFGSQSQRSRSSLALLMGMIQATVFAQSLSNFIFQLRRNPFIFGHRVILRQGQLCLPYSRMSCFVLSCWLASINSIYLSKIYLLMFSKWLAYRYPIKKALSISHIIQSNQSDLIFTVKWFRNFLCNLTMSS